MGRFAVTDIERPFAHELFCGTAILTRCLRDAGFHAFGVDLKEARLTALTPAVIRLDLSSQRGVDVILKLCEHPRLLYVHMGPHVALHLVRVRSRSVESTRLLFATPLFPKVSRILNRRPLLTTQGSRQLTLSTRLSLVLPLCCSLVALSLFYRVGFGGF